MPIDQTAVNEAVASVVTAIGGPDKIKGDVGLDVHKLCDMERGEYWDRTNHEGIAFSSRLDYQTASSLLDKLRNIGITGAHLVTGVSVLDYETKHKEGVQWSIMFPKSLPVAKALEAAGVNFPELKRFLTEATIQPAVAKTR